MPVITGSSYGYRPVPSQVPGTSVPGPYQSSAVIPEAFGAGDARALSQFGQTLETASNRLAEGLIERQRLFNEVAADDQINKVEDAINRKLYGDPDQPGNTGFLGMRGANAMSAYPKIRKEIEDDIALGERNLQNEQQRLRFRRAARNFRSQILQQTGRHYDRQFQEYAADEAKGRLELNQGKIGVAAAEGNFPRFKELMGTATLDIEERGRRLGLPQEAIEADKQKFVKQSAKEWAESLSVTDPGAAQQFIENNKDVLQDLYPELSARVRERALNQDAMAYALGGTPPKRQQYLVRGGATEGGKVPRGTAFSYGMLKKLAKDVGFQGEDADIMAAISMGESSGDPYAANEDGEHSYGLTQINADAHGPEARQARGDALYAMTKAKELYDARRARGQRGFEDWTVWTKGLYRQHLPFARAAQDEDYPGASLGGAAPAQLLENLPPRQAGELPDEQVPGLMDRIREMSKKMPANAPPELWWKSVQLAREMFNIELADTQQQERVRVQQEKQVVEKRTNEIYADAVSDNPTITPKMIAVDPAFNSDPVRRRAMIELVTKPPWIVKDDLPSELLAKDLVRRIRLPKGDPERINDLNEIYTHVATLNQADLDYALKHFNSTNNPGNKALEARRDLFVKKHQGFISESNPIAGIISPLGDAQLYKFEFFVDKKIEEYEKAGKDPNDLFNPTSKDFLGSPEIIRSFQLTFEQTREGMRSRVRGGLLPAQPDVFPTTPTVVVPIPLPPESARRPGESIEEFLRRAR